MYNFNFLHRENTHVYWCFFKYLNPCKFLHILFWYNMISKCICFGIICIKSQGEKRVSSQHFASYLKNNNNNNNKTGPCCNHIASEQKYKSIRGWILSKVAKCEINMGRGLCVVTPDKQHCKWSRKTKNKNYIIKFTLDRRSLQSQL